jgi:folate-binding protein YgfZ
MSNRYVMLPHRHILRLSGSDARSFLQGLVTQDVERVTPHQSVWTAMLNAQGKYLYDFFLIADGEHALLLDCDTSQVEELQRLLTMYKLRADAVIEDMHQHYHVVAAMGNLTPLALPETPGRTERYNNGTLIAYIDPRHAGMAARVIAPAGEAETWVLQRGYAQSSLADYEAWRISLGIPRAGVDSVAQATLILENGFEELNGVSFEKGCYVGQEVTARTKHRANLHKRLYIVRGEASLPAPQTPIILNERIVGEMRSSSGRNGLAVIRTEAVEKATQGEGILQAEGVTLHANNPPWRNSSTSV